MGKQTSFSVFDVAGVDVLQTGDLNGDGKVDLVVKNLTSGILGAPDVSSLLLGDGAGGFKAEGTDVFSGESSVIATGDWNGDGVDDVAVTSVDGTRDNTAFLVVVMRESQSATATASEISLPPATGSGQVVASYAGDSNYLPSTSAAVTLTAPQGPSKVTVAASSNPAPYGTSETLTATVSGSGLTPTGSVTFYDGAGQLTTSSLTNGVATYVTSNFAVGSHSITANYPGDANYTASTSAAIKLVIQKGPPAISIALSSSSILTTQSLNIQVTVAGAAGNPVPQGSVTVSGGGYTSAATSLSGGAATITIPAGSLSVGNDTLTVSYAPSAASAGSYTPGSQTAAVSVVLIGTGAATLTLKPSVGSITDQQSVNINVTLAGGTGLPAPTGSVTLASGAYNAQMALSNAATTFAVSAASLSAGTNTLTATYSGDGTYAAVTGTTTVTVSPVVIAVSAPSPVVPGASASAKVTLTAGSSYSGTVSLNCTLTSSPANAQSPPTCSLNPATPTIAAVGDASAMLTLKTTGATTTGMTPTRNYWGAAREGVVLAALLVIGIRVQRRRWMSLLALLLISITVLTIGCGGSHKSGPSPQPTTAGTYVLAITAADSKNAAIAMPASVSLTVQ
jgi:hypothetical protein